MKKLSEVNWKIVFQKEIVILLAWVLVMANMPTLGLVFVVLLLGGVYIARAMAHLETQNLPRHIFWFVLGILPLPTLCTYAVFYWLNKLGNISESVMVSGFKYSILLSAGLIALIFLGLIIHILVKFFPKRNKELLS